MSKVSRSLIFYPRSPQTDGKVLIIGLQFQYIGFLISFIDAPRMGSGSSLHGGRRVKIDERWNPLPKLFARMPPDFEAAFLPAAKICGQVHANHSQKQPHHDALREHKQKLDLGGRTFSETFDAMTIETATVTRDERQPLGDSGLLL